MSSEEESSDVDGVIVISVTEYTPECLIKRILDAEGLPTPSVCSGAIKGYEWKLDTKYYTTTVTLYAIPDKDNFEDGFCENIQATIFYFDGNQPSSFEKVTNWMPFLKDVVSEVQLLVCENCDSDEVHKKKILKWCIENQFELVEINPTLDSDEEEDDGLFSKAKGFGRVVSALEAHMWTNLTMKKEEKAKNPLTLEEMGVKNESAGAVSSSKSSSDASKTMKVENEEVLLEEQWLQKVFEQDDPEGEAFGALFTKFASMKEKASGLQGEDRKKYAEKVAVAFWKAMGGEEDEIEGLDDEED